jgi:titin
VGLVTPDETEWLDINSAAAAGEPIESMLPHPGHVYYYKVRAFNERGMSSYSAGASSQTRGLTLPAPTGLRAWLTSLRSIRLTWTDKASGETGYIVERMSYEQADFEVVALLSANSQAFEDKTIESGSYLYRVRAYSAANESAPAYSNYVGGTEWIHFIYLPLVRR